MGIQQPTVAPVHKLFSQSSTGKVAPLARSNRELATRPWSDESAPWQANATAAPGARPVTPDNAVARAKAIRKRNSHRAYDGAPPRIPHPVGQGSATECRACHEMGARIGSTVAPAMSHALFTMCTQCHVVEVTSVPANGPRPGMASVPNGFSGVRGTAVPYRWAAGTPPQIPHATFMRQKCTSCHGAMGLPGLQTSHPERQSCLQCHAPSRELDGGL